MAQIWLTYEELAEFTKRSAATAREAVIAGGWTRRRCRDGLTRVKLPPHAATLYMAHCLLDAEEPSAEEFVAALHAALDAMRSRPMRQLAAA